VAKPVLLGMCFSLHVATFLNYYIASFFVAFPIFSAVFAVVNDATGGWLLHFYTVAFVEYIELLGILVLYRLSFNKISKGITNNKKSID